MICECVELFNFSQFASPSFDTVERVPSLSVVLKIKANKAEISASESDGRRLARGGGTGSQGTERDDGVGDPELTCSDRLAIFSGGWSVGEDQVMGSQVKSAASLLASAC